MISTNTPDRPTVSQTAEKSLNATERKLLKQIQTQSTNGRSLVKFLSSTTCGFYW